jgi:mannitol 2-dehydrogenase
MRAPVALKAAHLDELASRGIDVPSYSREQTTIGIVHLGVGGFHRSHQAVYLDSLMNAGCATDWAICGIGVMPQDRSMQQALAAQDYLYTVIVKHAGGSLEPRVIGSIQEYLLAPDNPQAVIEKMAAPSTRIVSLTVTEGGYNLHPVTGEFDTRNLQVMRDALPGATPTTAFGLVTEALARRRRRGLAPFTVMSCDNILSNGDVAGRMFTAFAHLRGGDLGDWVQHEVCFPNTMVDRITPVTTDDDRAMLADRFGVTDAWPVVCEPFSQWVVQDRFRTNRPPLEKVGVQLVEDVAPYELMKLRLLNASHQAMCYLGYLAGYRYAHEVCADPLFLHFLKSYMDREATPTLAPVPGVDLYDYKKTLLERFANPEIGDTLARLCADSSDRIPKFVLPVIRKQLACGGDIERAALVVAAWARYAEGVDETNEPITVVDRLSESLMATARRQRHDPTAFIARRELFGDLVDDKRFVAVYTSALASLHTRGSRETLQRLKPKPLGP